MYLEVQTRKKNLKNKLKRKKKINIINQEKFWKHERIEYEKQVFFLNKKFFESFSV